uniref:Inositol polyphosphate 1-phosphatase n=1 Tax=Glossina brevipalpis TaxID=37001 RepID=A0A1A9WHT0_9MUSC
MTDCERNLLHSLINAAEKAANIARLCRSNEQLLSLLVQEKTGKEANAARFEHDFKTLADVLIQETIKHDVGVEFPEMLENIQGEESPSFANATGKAVKIYVGATEEETTECLLQVLQSEYEDAAKALALEVHRVVEFHKELHEDLPQLPPEIDYKQFGVWIDPIDATAEYISGDTMFTNFPGITSTGLDCVTVLIGVYDCVTGIPVLGIISQPFRNKIEDNIYTSSLYWGVALPDLRAYSKNLNTCPTHEGIMCIFSSSEQADLLQKMSDLGYAFAFSAGAGHKALKVITGEVDVYVLSKGSTYKWDTCAPQAILRSLNGDIFTFSSSIAKGKPIPLTYIPNEDSSLDDDHDNNWKCNSKGIIAIRNLDLMHDILKKLENV